MEQDGLSPLPQVDAKRERRFVDFDFWCQLSSMLSFDVGILFFNTKDTPTVAAFAISPIKDALRGMWQDGLRQFGYVRGFRLEEGMSASWWNEKKNRKKKQRNARIFFLKKSKKDSKRKKKTEKIKTQNQKKK